MGAHTATVLKTLRYDKFHTILQEHLINLLTKTVEFAATSDDYE